MINQGKAWGAIDIGSNSVRFLAARLDGEELMPLWHHLDTTRLGREVTRSGMLHPEAVERTMAALGHGVESMQKFGISVQKVATFATSAVREADNGRDFCRQVYERFGLEVALLSGETEGHLSYQGAVEGLPEGTAAGRIPVVLDIGGGSAEVVFHHKDRWWRQSFPLGAVRLTESPLSREGIASVWAPAVEKVRSLQWVGRPMLIGVGGTITTVAAIALQLRKYAPDKVHGYEIPQEKVKSIAQKLRAMDVVERKQVAGLQPQRADIIPAGLSVLEAFMEDGGFEEIVVSETDLLHAALKRIAVGEWPPRGE
ncbi:Ppx/GppA family phosphatase [Heliobacterium chlorum]|uniref:Ppx/GppA family phosphatase n=1 Tax=Heliobacterium chlorum TaxID=2698 RepID=A0ABR7T1J7_HELCL|nr:Ppx/GppA family phosphatase [Heliobacterium chlorum]MBC9784200.1 Ppx/GppA family phosphatase [Heliobacterium chlorum]